MTRRVDSTLDVIDQHVAKPGTPPELTAQLVELTLGPSRSETTVGDDVVIVEATLDGLTYHVGAYRDIGGLCINRVPVDGQSAGDST